jgi:hypothetical protein
MRGTRRAAVTLPDLLFRLSSGKMLALKIKGIEAARRTTPGATQVKTVGL